MYFFPNIWIITEKTVLLHANTKTVRKMRNNNYFKLLLSMLMAFMCQTATAQQLQASRSHLSTEDGLCSNAVSMISQDDLGFIWLATWNGLSRFDGYEFYNYKTGNSSYIKNLHNRILDIVIDQSQNVWMHMYRIRGIPYQLAAARHQFGRGAGQYRRQ